MPRSRTAPGWLLGLPLLAAAGLVANVLLVPHLENDLGAMADGVAARRTETRGASNEPGAESWLRVAPAGRDLVATGEAPDEIARVAALTELAALPGVRRVVDRVGLVAPRSPFVWRARRRARDRIDLTGYRPVETGRAALRARFDAALPPGLDLRDRSVSARGAPLHFDEAASFALAQIARLAPGAVADVSDGKVNVAGEAETVEAYAAITTEFAAHLPAGFTTGSIAVLAPEIRPFVWSARREEGGGIVLAGYVASEHDRAAIVEAARDAARAALGADVALRDAMQPGRGLPSGVDARDLARFAVATLPLLRAGAVALEDGRMSVEGDAIDAQAVGEIADRLARERPAGVGEGSVTVDAHPPRPYRTSIRRAADAVVLSGHLPDAAARDEILRALRGRLFGERIVDRSRLADGAPDGLVQGLVAGAAAVGQLAAGEVVIEDRAIRLGGESLYAGTAERLGRDGAHLSPPGWPPAIVAVRWRDAPVPRDPTACGDRLVRAAETRPLRFAPGSVDLAPDFYPVLDALAATARDCPGLRVAVAGPSDEVPSAAVPAPALPPAARPAAGPAAAGAAATDKAAGAEAGAKPSSTGDGGKGAPRASVTPRSSEPDPELPRRRAAAIIDYLVKAGVGADRLLVAATPSRRIVGFEARS